MELRAGWISTARRVSAHLPITLLLMAAFCIGILTVRDYGESWDEADNFRYADYAIHAYTFFFHPADLPPFETNLNLKGPAYFMFAEAGAGLLTRLIPAWTLIDARHLIDFVMFLVCSLAVYLLSRRWVGEAAALGGTALFLSQPLLWGHAFINPKDVPFMALFSLGILAGLAMVDRYGRHWDFGMLVVLASVLLGITTSVRVIAPLAALIVLGYGAWKLGRKVILLAVPYVGIAALTTYLTWPYLWSAPISRFIESIRTMSDFPFSTYILFEGHLYKANELPKSYFPKLLTLQLTEPMLILLALGIIICVWSWSRKRYREPAALFLAWFLIPAALIVGYGSPLYDNGRQLYFLLPPLFVVAAVALDRLFAFVPHTAVRAVVVLAAALPGLLVGARLHPYEYVYYNALVGGTGGAFRTYEMDYWGTSLKELTAYINATAAPASRVLVFGPQQIVAAYARSDIQTAVPGDQAGAAGFDYAVLLTRENLDERRCRKAEIVDEVGRRGQSSP